jgi:hypothetical protein
VLLLVLALLTWVGMQQLSTPDVVPASAPATEFSGERAMEHLRAITSEPRAVGLPGHTATRQYLVDQLQAMGLEPQVQATSVVLAGEEGAEGFGAGTVYTVVARIPGSDSTGAIALNAHYDSGATGPGAMDAGSGVVTILETLRAIQAGPVLRNDLIVVFADAEEEGMLGAAAFNEQHPWARDVRLALYYEGAGGDGPALLYATSEDDSWLVSEYLDVAPEPSGSSLMSAIVDLFTSGRLDCDLGEYTEEGSAGLGFVVLGDTPAYHTIRDNADEIDPGSIQQEGANTLAAVRHFGTLDLSDMPRSGDRVVFNIWQGVVVHYAISWVIPLSAIVTALVAGLLVAGFRRGELTTRGLVAGTLVFLIGTPVTVVIAALLWFVIRAFNSDYQVMLIGSYRAGYYVVALSLVTIALMVAIFTLLSSRVRRHDLAAGALLGSLPSLWVVGLAAPAMSYLVTWPLLFAMLPLAWAILARARATHPWWRVLVLSVAAIPTIVLLPGTLHAMMGLVNRMEGLTGIALLGVLMLFVAPLVGLLVPHVQFVSGEVDEPRRRWFLPATAALVAFALIAWGNATSGFDAEHPRPNQIAYELNADTGQAQWVSFDRNLDAWTKQLFPDGSERVEHESVMLGTQTAFVAPAPVTSVASPEVVVLRDTTDGELRTLRLRLASPRGARIMAAELDVPGELVALSVDGRPIDLSTLDWARDGAFPVVYRNAPAAGWELTLAVRAIGPVVVQVEETKDGLPAIPGTTIQPRPADMMPAPAFARDPTIVTKTFSFE